MADELITRVNEFVGTLSDKMNELSEPKVARYSGENSQAGSAHTVELDAEMFNTYNFGLGDGKIRIPENGFYEIAIVGNTLNLSSQMYLEVIIGGVGNLKILVATSPPRAGGMSGTTGVIELELNDTVSVRAQGVPNIGNLKIELSIKKL